MLSALQFSIFLVSSFIEDFLFISFQQKNEIKRGNTLIEFKYLKVNISAGVILSYGVIIGLWRDNKLLIQFYWEMLFTQLSRH